MEDLISASRKYVVAATGSSPFKVRDNQRPERTMSGVENLRLSVPSPVEGGREGESGRNELLRALSRPLRVSGKLKSNLPQLYKNAHLRHIVTPVNGSTEWPRQGPPPHLTRETISGRRPADRADTPGGVFRPGENLALGRRGR